MGFSGSSTPVLHHSMRFVIYSLRAKTIMSPMRSDCREIFGNIAEKEKIKGHHSPEGRAIRTLSRGLDGWTSGNLSSVDVLVLCDQSIEDWLKARLKISSWSASRWPELLQKALSRRLLDHAEAARLRKIHRLRESQHRVAAASEVKRALIFCLQVVEKHW
jgi:hypothetical protein